MTSPGSAHPLDVDLADLADGVVDEDRAARLDAHLADCLLCRIKCLRLIGAPPAGQGGSLPSPAFTVPTADPAAGGPAAGEIRLAGGEEGILVLVVRTGAGRAHVVPVTLDVEAADEQTAVVGGYAVHPALPADVPVDVLGARVATLAPAAGVPALLAGGAGPGPAAAGSADPRLQVRQHLADRLRSLDDTPPVEGITGPQPAEQTRSTLIADLRALRGAACTVRALATWGDLVEAAANGWVPVATVEEVGVVLVVLDTPHGLADERDFGAARSVLTRHNATALVVLAGELGDGAEVFDPSSLHAGIDMPSGAHTPPRPLISGLVAFDAIAKFLDGHSGARAMSPPTRGPVARVDIADVLRDAAATAAADAARQGSRFKIAPKRRGYESLAGATEAFGAALATAFTDGSVVDALAALARLPQEDGG